jgi:ATP-dependent Lon protease
MASQSSAREIPPEKLRWQCPKDLLPFATTKDLQPIRTIVGQERAVAAIRTGLEMKSPGFNVFVAGPSGTGRTTTVRHLLSEVAAGGPVPDDWCYVHNFDNPDCPAALRLPAGKARALQQAMDRFIARLRRDLPKVFTSEVYRERRNALIERFGAEQRKRISAFEQKARKEGFVVVQVQVGITTRPDLVPVVEERPVPFEKLEALAVQGQFDSAKLETLREKYQSLMVELGEIVEGMRQTERQLAEAVHELDRQTAETVLRHPLDELRARFPYPRVREFLQQVRSHILAHLDELRSEESSSGAESLHADPLNLCRVNVVVDNSGLTGPPIVFENQPSHKNLFGTIERVVGLSGEWRSDFTHIRAGSFAKANGGYLVLQARDVLLEPNVWPALKRALKARQVEIQALEGGFPFPGSTLKPEPIPCDVKVILIGDREVYSLLYQLDDDFKKVFKVKAEFDDVMPRSPESIAQYASFVKKVCEDEELLPFDREAVGKVVEFGVRLAGDRGKISTRFNDVADLIRESSYCAAREKAKLVTASHVQIAWDARLQRLRLPEEKLQELIREGLILVDTEGCRVGQVNGLSILDLGDYRFGRPSRITAQVSVGRAGVINVEREAELSGPIHSKGVLIIAGYLRGLFARDKPLAMSASICFEQLYSGVEGDSASSAEVFALLSALADVPLRQDLAVTGSVNQLGEIQPVGGVNEKIEGFFDVCKARGLTGGQGVIIPARNIEDLVLREDVVDAVRRGQFRIYAIATVEEGIELLTGLPAGRRPDGSFEPDSVFARADARLREFAETARRYSGEGLLPP